MSKLDISLYHLEQGLADLIAYRAERVAEIDGPLAEGELEAIDAEIQRYEMATPAKVSGVAAIIRSWRAQKDTAKAEIARLKGIVEHLESMDARLKDYVASILERLPVPAKGSRKLTGNDGSVLSLKGNGGLQPLEITDESMVPDEYKRVTIVMAMPEWRSLIAQDPEAPIIKAGIEVDNAAVRAALEQPCEACGGNPGLMVDGCQSCGGSGKRGVPGARLLARANHVECK